MMMIGETHMRVRLGFYAICYLKAKPYYLIRLHEAIDKMAGRRGR